MRIALQVQKYINVIAEELTISHRHSFDIAFLVSVVNHRMNKPKEEQYIVIFRILSHLKMAL